MGSKKASVLPVPVCAVARMSLPLRAGGMAWAWTVVGLTNSWVESRSCREAEIGNWVNRFIEFLSSFLRQQQRSRTAPAADTRRRLGFIHAENLREDKRGRNS